MIKPFLQGEDVLRDVRATLAEDDAFHVWWLGQSGFLLQWNGRHLLFDPYLSDSLTKKYATTDKPHVRMTERVIDPEKLDFIDVVTSSHNHTDHLDAETLGPLLRVNPGIQMIIPEANRQFVADRLTIPLEKPIGLDAGQSTVVAGFRISAVPAAHETVERDDRGRCRFLGYVVQFGNFAIYHSGDTVLYPGMVETLRHWKIDLALLPINGANPARRVAGNLNGAEAAKLACDMGARCVVPCHFEMFEFNTATPDEFLATAQHLRQRCHILRAGERLSSTRLTVQEL